MQQGCEAEFTWFENERSILTKAETEAEKNYDTLLVTLSTLAIGSTFTLLKDVPRTSAASALLILAWTAFGLCLLISLLDRLLSYWTHHSWRKMMDQEFKQWREGARERVTEAYSTIPFVCLLPSLKWLAFGTLLFGLIFLLGFVFVGTGKSPAASEQKAAVANDPPATPTAILPSRSPTTRDSF